MTSLTLSHSRIQHQGGHQKLFQNPQLFPELTVLDHMRIACHLHLKRTLGWKRLKSLVINTANADVALDTAKRVDHILELCRLTDVRHGQAQFVLRGRKDDWSRNGNDV